MKVLLVEYFGRGGIAHYTHCLSQALTDNAVDVTLYTATGYEFATLSLPYRYREVFNIYQSGGESRPQTRFKVIKGLGFLLGCWRLPQLVAAVMPDVLHIQSSSLLPLVELGLMRWFTRGGHLVYTIHNLLPHEVHEYHRWLYSRIYRLPQALIVHGEAVKEDLNCQFGPTAPVYVIPHGEYSFLSRPENTPSQASARQWLGVPHDAPLILFFGAIRDYKGLDTLLAALPEVFRDVPKATALIVGKPHGSFDTYQRQLEGLGLAGRVQTTLEYVPHERVPVYFAAADVVALPYKRTYQSGVVQLAYAAARPVVTTLTGALPEVVEDGQSGLLVAPNDPHALAQALVRLLRDSLMAKRMGEYGRDLAEKCFSWDAIARQTVQVYQEIQRQK